jgi:hypothetical protein
MKMAKYLLLVGALRGSVVQVVEEVLVQWN